MNNEQSMATNQQYDMSIADTPVAYGHQDLTGGETFADQLNQTMNEG